MQQFEVAANYAVSLFPYQNGGRLALLPGPCHFLDMDKAKYSGVFETFNRDILEYGSSLVKDHWMKLYVMAEDRHLSTLYASKTGLKTAWVSSAQFFYKPEKTWIDVLQQRVRWQGGTFAQQFIIVFRPEVLGIGSQPWAWWYVLLSALTLVQFLMNCCGNAIWIIVTQSSRSSSPFPAGLRDIIFGTIIWSHLLFPWIWVAWASRINKGNVKYEDIISTVMIFASLVLSAVTVAVNSLSFFSWGIAFWTVPKLLVFGLTIIPLLAWILQGPAVSLLIALVFTRSSEFCINNAPSSRCS
jgi:hypothetical protein